LTWNWDPATWKKSTKLLRMPLYIVLAVKNERLDQTDENHLRRFGLHCGNVFQSRLLVSECVAQTVC
jgi:hypothetical protein